MKNIDYKYDEGEIIETLHKYIDNTYNQHYISKDDKIQCFDCWFALGNALTSFRDTAIKYLWRLGKKGNKEDELNDLLKTMHYCILAYHTIKKGK